MTFYLCKEPGASSPAESYTIIIPCGHGNCFSTESNFTSRTYAYFRRTALFSKTIYHPIVYKRYLALLHNIPKVRSKYEGVKVTVSLTEQHHVISFANQKPTSCPKQQWNVTESNKLCVVNITAGKRSDRFLYLDIYHQLSTVAQSYALGGEIEGVEVPRHTEGICLEQNNALSASIKYAVYLYHALPYNNN
jgi:hypothetical protein